MVPISPLSERLCLNMPFVSAKPHALDYAAVTASVNLMHQTWQLRCGKPGSFSQGQGFGNTALLNQGTLAYLELRG